MKGLLAQTGPGIRLGGVDQVQSKSNLLPCFSSETLRTSCIGDKLSSRAQQSSAIRAAIFESAAAEDALITVDFSSVVVMVLIQFALLCKLKSLASTVIVIGPPLEFLVG